jgi:hypothetical protein
MRLIDKTNRLLAEHTFLEMSMEEGVGHVQLLRGPAARRGDGEHSADSGWLDHGSECFTKVDAGALSEATHDPSSFVMLQ